MKAADRATLERFFAENLPSLTEEEALAILDNPFVTSQICGHIAQTPRLTGYYSVRVKLVAHRQTPQAHSAKLVHYLHWPDLLRLSVNVMVPATVRRALETQLLVRVGEISLGERISSARACSSALFKMFLFDPNPNVFEALLVNPRLREDDLLLLANSPRAAAEQLRLLAADPKWSYRYAIRRALVMNPITPRAAAASLLRFLKRRDLEAIYRNPKTSTYVRRCIERLPAGWSRGEALGASGTKEF